MIQRKIFLFGVLVMLFLMPQQMQAQRGVKIRTIVIDAGHGGKDSGALGREGVEKDINLSVALKLGQYINKYLPDVRVIYTRTTDKFVELSERAAIANRNHADVFISIHCNSTEGVTRVDGVETYVMGESKNEANLNVAKKENASILLEASRDAYDNFDPNSTEAYILFSLTQSVYQKQSLKLAAKVQRQFAVKLRRHSRGVQQAGFLVLWKTSMPSILVELGFINNPAEEKYINSERGQAQMALALYNAFAEYKAEFEFDNHVATVDMRTIDVPENPRETMKNPDEKNPEGTNKPGTQNKPEVSEKPQPARQPEVKEEPATAQKPEATEKPVQYTGENYYTVQISTIKKMKPVTDEAFRGVKDVTVEEYNGTYRYYSGRFETKAEANARVKEVATRGFKDAFVVYYKNGVRQKLD